MEANLADETEVVIAEEPPAPSSPKSEEDKDKVISELQAQLAETNKQLAELVNGREKDSTNTTNINITVDKASAGRRGVNPLILALRKLRNRSNASAS